jgi:ribose 5-phosphate isomerase B
VGTLIISLGNDHAGYLLKPNVVQILNSLGMQIIDHGSYDDNPVDFPDIAKLVCESVLTGRANRGIMVCGTGVGASIAANKIPGIRASVCHDVYSARQCVEHDDVNVMCIGAQIIGPTLVKEYIEAFVKATFSTEEQFKRRVAKLTEMERAFYNPS